jgi:hypothetical protein
VAASGQATVRVRFTAKARHDLRRKRQIKLTIAGGAALLKVTVRR